MIPRIDPPTKLLPSSPERLNLAIAKGCFVSCPGCYSYFGRNEPDLARLLESVSRFVDMGVQNVTLSGGDPLTVTDILSFLKDLRRIGVRSIKLDTVGTGLVDETVLPHPSLTSKDWPTLPALLKRVDFLGIPLDGWSNRSVSLFRTGRTHLYQETTALLDAIDDLVPEPIVVVNTVAHAMNLDGLPLVWTEILRHSSICHWNVFQYSPTDQTTLKVNETYSISDKKFAAAQEVWQSHMSRETESAHGITVEFKSVRSRLGQYLLINSDGSVWIPNDYGQTIALGSIFNREQQILQDWSVAVMQLKVQDNLSEVL